MKTNRSVFMKVDPEFRKRIKIESSLRDKSMLDFTTDLSRNKDFWNIKYDNEDLKANTLDLNKNNKKGWNFKPF